MQDDVTREEYVRKTLEDSVKCVYTDFDKSAMYELNVTLAQIADILREMKEK